MHAADLGALQRGDFTIEVLSVSRGAGVLTGRFRTDAGVRLRFRADEDLEAWVRDLAAREKAWATFRADPEWVKLRTTAGFTDAEIVTGIDNQLLAPAEYSQV